jgi:rfaE bifunctional protein kinase chain/domain
LENDLVEDSRETGKGLSGYVDAFHRRRILVVGDAVADQFLYGEISRVSREAPVFILRHERTETTPGGAANCALNLASLNAQAVMVGLVGEDSAGVAIGEKLLAARVECDNILTSKDHQTPTKVRILAGQAHSTRQQVIRVDYDSGPSPREDQRAKLRARVREQARTADAIIISDYNYGVADDHMISTIRKAVRYKPVPVLVDSRFGLARFPGFTSATPNEDEVEHLLGRHFADANELESEGENVRGMLDCEALLVTRGSRGMILFQKATEPLKIEAVGGNQPVDGTGAGDTVIATYALGLACGASFVDAANLANHAGGLVVMKRGTASINREELLTSIKRWEA